MADRFLQSVQSLDVDEDVQVFESPTKRTISASINTDVGDTANEPLTKKLVVVDKDAISDTSELRSPSVTGSVS